MRQNEKQRADPKEIQLLELDGRGGEKAKSYLRLSRISLEEQFSFAGW